MPGPPYVIFYHPGEVKYVARGINPLQIRSEKVRPTANFSPPAGLEPTTSGLPDWRISPLRHIATYVYVKMA